MGMADGYAQASGRVAHVNLHTAPGVGNAMGALFNAQANKTPLLVTAGQQVRAHVTMQANLTNRDATRVPHPFVKWSYEPPRAEDVPAALARAIHHATLPPGGPAFVSIPMDDWNVEADDAETARAIARRVNGRAVADPEAVRDLAARLEAAKNPVLVVGPDVDISGAWEAAVALAERQRLPVWATPAPGGGRIGFPEGHAHYQGVLPPAIGPVGQTLEGHDLVLVAGSLGLPLLPVHPRAGAPRGRDPGGHHQRPRRGGPRSHGRRAGGRRATHAGGAGRGRRRVRPPAARAARRAAPTRGRRPARPRRRPRDAGRGAARRRDRRARVADQHHGAAQPAAHLAARQLLLRRRRRAGLRPRRRHRRSARPARPARRVRARRGLGPVRDHRLLDGRRLQGPRDVPDHPQRRVRDPQVVRRGGAGRPGRRGSTSRRSRSR